MDDTELKIAEIEINPLFVYENQVKAICLACRVKPKVSHHTWELKRTEV